MDLNLAVPFSEAAFKNIVGTYTQMLFQSLNQSDGRVLNLVGGSLEEPAMIFISQENGTSTEHKLAEIMDSWLDCTFTLGDGNEADNFEVGIETTSPCGDKEQKQFINFSSKVVIARETKEEDAEDESNKIFEGFIEVFFSYQDDMQVSEDVLKISYIRLTSLK